MKFEHLLKGIIPDKYLALKQVKLAIVQRVSTCLIDTRCILTKSDLTLLKSQYKKRLFDNGLNSFDSQMQPAFSYQSPKGLYRFLTGQLMASVQTNYKTGEAQVSVTYDNIILATLEDRYGFMFAWSPQDIAYIDKVVEARLIAQGFDVEPNDDLLLNRRFQLENERNNIISEMNAAKIASQDTATVIAIPEPLTDSDGNIIEPKGIAGSMNFEYMYDSSLRLTQADIVDIENYIRDRVAIQGLTANDTIIKRADIPFLDPKTVNSIKIVKTRNGLLTMKVTFYTQEAMLLHTNRVKIFGFSPNDISYIDTVLNRNI